jgi:glycosyltransferase involved in cell wall biosynthesis
MTAEKETILYSVVIPAYNADKTLSDTLIALKHQSIYPADYEVIVVDDGSTDKTAALAHRFGANCINQPNRGPAAARNNGVRVAKGDIILFTDADCLPDWDWIRQMTLPFQNKQTVGVKGTYRTRQTELAARFAQAEFEDRYDLLKKVAAIDMVDTYSASFRREVLITIGLFDESFPVANNEDAELSYRLCAAGYLLEFNPRAFLREIFQVEIYERLLADGCLSEISGKSIKGHLYPRYHQASNSDGSSFDGGYFFLFCFSKIVNSGGMVLSGHYGIFDRFFYKNVQKRSFGRFGITGCGSGTSHCVCIGESFWCVSQAEIVIAARRLNFPK